MSMKSPLELHRPPTSLRYRHPLLLVCLLLVIVVRPFLVEQVFGVALVDILVFATIVAGALATMETPRQRLVIGGLAALAGTAQIALFLDANVYSAYCFIGSTLLFYAAVAFQLARQMFRPAGCVTSDTLLGALSLYLIIGLVWSAGYALLELTVPRSFVIASDPGEVQAHFERFMGFSFATLTTLGYGNVAPANPRADALATLEAIVGQVYLAVVVARLVALQLIQGNAPTSKQHVEGPQA